MERLIKSKTNFLSYNNNYLEQLIGGVNRITPKNRKIHNMRHQYGPSWHEVWKKVVCTLMTLPPVGSQKSRKHRFLWFERMAFDLDMYQSDTAETNTPMSLASKQAKIVPVPVINGEQDMKYYLIDFGKKRPNGWLVDRNCKSFCLLEYK